MSGETTAARTIDEGARRRFEAAWKAGRPEPIEHCLPPEDHPAYLLTLEELVLIELEFFWKTARRPADGDSPTADRPPFVEAYLARFPRLNQPDVVLRLLEEEYLVRRRFGDRPTEQEYRTRFPDLVRTGREIGNSLPGGPDAPPARVQGERVGRYLLRAEHARGGFGLVWRADDETLGREVALKELSPPLAGHAGTRRRFLAEARIAAQLQHPGIVPVYELGGADAGGPFYTMKLVRGQTLGEAIRRFHESPADSPDRPVEHLRLLNAFLAVARAMAYVHSRGVLHRDLKPDNVLLGDFGETVILDWGLAKVRGSAVDDAAAAPVATTPGAADLTVHGTVMGTPAYMAPEQAAGRTGEVDERSDVYALGAILYQLLTGRPPFAGNSSEEVLQQVLSAAPPRPRALDPHVPRALEAICLRALAPPREARYADMASLARDLERYLADEPVSADREPWHARLGRWARRHRTTVTAAAVALVLVVVGAVAGLFLWQEGEHLRQQETERHLAGLRRSAEEGETFALAELRAGRFASAARMLLQTVEALGGEPSLGELRGRLADRQRRAHGLAEFYRLIDDAERFAFLEYDDEARAACEGALDALGVTNDPEWAENLPAAELLDPTQPDPTRQLQHVREDVYRALMLLSALQVRSVLLKGANDPETLAACRAALATVARYHHFRPSFAGRLVEVFCRLRLGELARMPPKTVREPTSTADYYFTGMAHGWLAHVPRDAISKMFVLGPVRTLTGLDLDAPAETAQRLLRTAADREPRHYWTNFWLAWMYEAAGDNKAAAQAYDTCVALRPDYALGHVCRGFVVVRQARDADTDQRRRHLERRGLADLERALRLEPHEPFIHWMHARALSELKRPAEVLRACGRMLDLERPLAASRGQRVHEEKKALLAQVTTLAGRLLAERPDDADTLAVRAQACLALEAHDDALRDATRALELRPDHPRALKVRGRVSLERGRPDRALEDFDRVLMTAADPAAAGGRAEALALLGRSEEALAGFEHFLKVAVTDWQRVQGHAGRAQVLTRLGRHDEARRAVEEVRRLNPAAAGRL